MSNSIKDALSGAQSGGQDFPKMNHATPVEIKESSDGAVFTVWNKNEKENQQLESPIEGILIGVAMQAGAFSDRLGKNGGNYKSAYYITNKNVVLFAPTPKGYEVVAKGNMETVENFITKEAGTNTKKKQVLFVLTPSGLLAVITNLSIGIDQYGVNKEALTERYIVLNPKTFSESDKVISKKAKEYLGKFRTKNPPKYAEITTGDTISMDHWEQWGAQKEVDNYKKWRDWSLQGAPDPAEIPAKAETEKPSHSAPKRKDKNENAEAAGWNPNPPDIKDDLPF